MSNRREFMTGAAVATATLVASRAGAAGEPSKEAKDKDPYSDVAASSTTCVRTGEACVAHCTDELGRGNTAMANCNKRVHEMLALTRAMLVLASTRSELAKRQAAVCADACKACAAACLEHKEHWSHGMHKECKACYDACVDCEKACRALMAA